MVDKPRFRAFVRIFYGLWVEVQDREFEVFSDALEWVEDKRRRVGYLNSDYDIVEAPSTTEMEDHE